MMPAHLNEAFNDPERTVSEIITTVAPHLGKKFHDLQTIGRILSNMSHIGKMGADISKVSDMSHMGQMGGDVSKIGKLGGEMSNNTVETSTSTSAGTFPDETAQPRVNLIDAIKSSKELIQDNREENRMADTTTKSKKNKKKNVDSGDFKKAFSLMNLEHFALATAIGALRGKRNNSIVCLRDGLYGNEVLNDITMVLHMLQQKKVEKYSTIEKMMKQMTNLQQELQVGRI